MLLLPKNNHTAVNSYYRMFFGIVLILLGILLFVSGITALQLAGIPAFFGGIIYVTSTIFKTFLKVEEED